MLDPPFLLNDFTAGYQTGVETQHRIVSFSEDIPLVIKNKVKEKEIYFLTYNPSLKFASDYHSILSIACVCEDKDKTSESVRKSGRSQILRIYPHRHPHQ